LPKSLHSADSRAEVLRRLGAPTAQELLSTQPSYFEADAARLRALMERFGTAKGRSEWPEHPLFGPLSEAEWGHLGYRHIDHHFGQFGV